MHGKGIMLVLLLSLIASLCPAAGGIHVDRKGVMRDRATGEEVSYYGVNYTVPFAHAYRALGYLGVDRKEAIDRDVYHFARLGFNAFRVHIWDVEISDSAGNLLSNDHLDLLDYLIARVEERGISVVLTAQTNFGNGYPEKNVDTGAYSYDYWKSEIHSDPDAVAAQERYIRQLVAHVNPYNGKRYCDDEAIIAMEINNEPSHGGTADDVEKYINRMVKAMKAGGWRKIILYNVSHNEHCVEGYYNADIDGTTYQWYPMNLVRNSVRRGNYLPFVDRYDIPFSNLRNFDRMARVVYEFDPADNLYSHLYPAVVRTFRKTGFQWITQFAYDPLDMAWANTEYQTHYLNLAYTPRKALSMKIAAEAAREIPRGTDFGKYPADTLFGDFTVSYRRDLSEYNSGKKFFHTNNTSSEPKNVAELKEIAGWGSSPVVSYEGTGAYFLDEISEGVWRLEVMPDVVMVKDPFRTPSLKERTAEIIWTENRIGINLPQLGDDYSYKAVNQGNDRKGKAEAGAFGVYPGTYLLSAEGAEACHVETFGYMKVSEYVAPKRTEVPLTVVHSPQKAALRGGELKITATVIGEPDSVLVYPRNISMWNERNVLHKMERRGKYTFETVVKPQWDTYEYNIVAYSGGRTVTWPGAKEGNPLDWDFIRSEIYATELYSAEEPLVLLEPGPDMDGSEYSTIPDSWSGTSYRFVRNSPMGTDVLRLEAKPEDDINLFIIKHVADEIRGRVGLDDSRRLCVAAEMDGGDGILEVGVVNRDGITFSARVSCAEGIAELGVDSFEIAPTSLCPAPYPVFLGRYFYPDENLEAELHWNEIEEIKICVPDVRAGSETALELRGIWIK